MLMISSGVDTNEPCKDTRRQGSLVSISEAISMVDPQHVGGIDLPGQANLFAKSRLTSKISGFAVVRSSVPEARMKNEPACRDCC